MKYYKITLVIALIAALFLVGRSHTKPEPLVKVRFGYLPVVQALPLYLALDKGYFEDAGIEVEVTKFEAPNQIIDALLANNLDMSMAGATGITAIAESKKPNSLRIFAVQGGDSNHFAERLIIHKDSSIKSISDLRGKKVGVLPGIQWRTIARNLFAHNKLDIDKDLTLVELAIPLQPQALASKQVDALLAIEPVPTISDSLGIAKTLMESPNLDYISNPFYGGVGNVTVSFTEKHPETFKKVMGILDRATKEIEANEPLARLSLPRYTPLNENLSQKVNLPKYKMYTDMNSADREAIKKFIDLFVVYKVIDNPPNIETLIYHD